MTPEELYAKKKAEKKAARRSAGEEEANLNITSLMDVVSIIVVYLLKSYGTDPIFITPTSGQKIPFSSADLGIQDGVPVYVSSRSITFDSEVVTQLNDDGEVDAAAIEGGNLIRPLYDKMKEEAEKAKILAEARGEPWNARVVLIGDEALKFSTLVKVMFTAGKAEFAEYHFAIIQGG